MAKKKSAKKPAAKRPAAKPGKKNPLAHIAEPLRAHAVPIDSLMLDGNNARKHDEANVANLAALLAREGQVLPLVFNAASGIVVIGNGRLMAARRLGWSHVAAVPVERDAGGHMRLAIADNRSAELSEWNQAELLKQLEAVQASDGDLYELLRLAEHGVAPDSSDAPEVKPLDVKAAPVMSWALVGIPTVRFGEIAADIERIAALPEVVCETTVTDGRTP